jgi:hypothetical protein
VFQDHQSARLRSIGFLFITIFWTAIKFDSAMFYRLVRRKESYSSCDCCCCLFPGCGEISGSFQMRTELSGVAQRGQWSIPQPSRLPTNRTCSICGRSFFNKERFEDHMNMHNNIKAHECRCCRTKFTYKRNLLTHVRLGVCTRNSHPIKFV